MSWKPLREITLANSELCSLMATLHSAIQLSVMYHTSMVDSGCSLMMPWVRWMSWQ